MTPPLLPLSRLVSTSTASSLTWSTPQDTSWRVPLRKSGKPSHPLTTQHHRCTNHIRFPQRRRSPSLHLNKRPRCNGSNPPHPPPPARRRRRTPRLSLDHPAAHSL